MFCVEVTHVIPYGYMSAWRGVCSYVCALRGRWCARAYTHLVHTAEVLDGGLDRVESESGSIKKLNVGCERPPLNEWYTVYVHAMLYR